LASAVPLPDLLMPVSSTACLFRVNALSLVYLLFLLLLPWFPGPTRHSIRGHTGRLLRALLCLSLLFLVAQLTFQICLHTVPHLDQLLGSNCSRWETLSQHVGVTRLDLKDIPNTIRLVAPDLGILVVSSVCLGLCRRLTRKTRENPQTHELAHGLAFQRTPERKGSSWLHSSPPAALVAHEDDDVDVGPLAGLQGGPATASKQRSRLATRFRVTAHWLLVAAGRTLAVTLLALAGIAHPSASSSIYLLAFLTICTWWACHLPISPLGFSTLCIMVGCFGAGHLICLYCYQIPYAQDILPPAGIWARVFGLKDFLGPSNCSSPNALTLNTSHDWPVYVSPGVLLLLYYTVTSLLKLHRPDPSSQTVHREREMELAEMDQWSQDGEATQVRSWFAVPTPAASDTNADRFTWLWRPVLPPGGCWWSGISSPKPVHPAHARLPKGKLRCRKGLYQVPLLELTSVPLCSSVRPRLAEPKEPSPLHGLGHLVMDQSYVCALIAMMVWSITYHSWLTFVLLLWACLIWTVRSRRQLALLCSPCLLLYGLALCGLRYVWAMDLRPELPTTLGPISLRQLGLEHTRYPCLDLGAMLLYTLTFWLLLRQFVKEKLLKTKKALAELTEVTVADTGAWWGPGVGLRVEGTLSPPDATTTLPCLVRRAHTDADLRSLGEVVKGAYAKYWIYVCAGMFIVVSFAGRLVVYKIVYMFLFLLCLTLFQVYYSLWRKLLKAFWWLVVAYTMLVLVAVYTFQFQDFPTYWRNLTGFTDEQLGDLGLEQFSVSELFSSILVPGFFLLACILQLHYFHRPFMQLTDLERPLPPPTSPPRWTHSLAGCTHLVLPLQQTRWWSQSGLCVLEPPELRERAGTAGKQDPVSRTPLLQEEEGAPRAEDPSSAGLRPTMQVPDGTASKWGLVAERLLDLAAGFSDVLGRVQVFVWRLLELHVFKLVAMYTVWVALKEVSVMNLLLVALWAFALPYPHFRPMASCLSTVWTCVIIVCKMLYQLKAVDPVLYSRNCTKPFPNSTNLLATEINQSVLYRGPVDPANWFGVRKGYPNLGYIQNHLQILLLLIFEAMVYRGQEQHRRQHQLAPPPAQAVCADGTRQQLDQDLLSCLKYFINFFFYKFGLEICFLMAVNVIGQHMNFMVILHGCWLVAILTRRQRRAIARLWPNYCLFLTLFLLYQYLLCLGVPPVLCKDYPWRWSQAIPMNSALIKWLYLPDFFQTPNSTNLFSDFLLLLCASQQWQVFSAERTEEWQRVAGPNTDHPEPLRGEPNPVPNFIHCRSYLDMVKVAVFRYLFWLVLVVVFITGATRISVFGLGYLLACFYLLLFGTSLLQKDTRAQLVLWDCLILYNVTVIISKNMLSLLSCVFVEQMQTSFCWVIQLFSLVCTVKGYYNPQEMMAKDQDCLLPVEEAGILWDSVCFCFLLLQRRAFLSYYFLYVRADLQATALQASRGFALYNAANLKSIDSHRQAEEKSLAQLKRQMERIRAKQEKHRHPGRSHPQDPLGPEDSGQEPGEHRQSPKRRQWWRPWLDHASVIHSGDYFLFESDSEEEEEALPEDPRPSAQSPFQMAYQAWVTNAQTVLRQRQRQDQAGQLPTGELGGWVLWWDQEVEPVEGPEEEVTGRSHMLQRVLSTVQFLWVLGQALVDALTHWLWDFTRHHRTMSDVLLAERYLLTQQLLRVSTAPPTSTPWPSCPACPNHALTYPPALPTLHSPTHKPLLLTQFDSHVLAPAASQLCPGHALPVHATPPHPSRPCPRLHPCLGTISGTEGEVSRGVLDQLYASVGEATLPGFSEARHIPSTGSSQPDLTTCPPKHLGVLLHPLPILKTGYDPEQATLTQPPSGSMLGAEEPLSSVTDTSSPLSTGYHTRSGSEEAVTDPGESEAKASQHSSRELPASTRIQMRTASELLLDRCLQIPELEEAEQFAEKQGRALRLLWAAYQCVAAHSELLCYFIIILNHMVTASASSLVLPVLVFLWAMLSIPRPSKRFWMTAIVFTEVVVVTKYLFQFGFFPWNSHAVLRRYENKPYFPPRILGLEKTDGYVKYDLLQLMVLFFHRSQLLCYGLWDHDEDPLSKEDDRNSGKEQESEEEPGVLLGPQTEAGTGLHMRRISLRFRKRKRASPEPEGPAAIGIVAPTTTPSPSTPECSHYPLTMSRGGPGARDSQFSYTDTKGGEEEEEEEEEVTASEKQKLPGRSRERVRAQSVYRPLRCFFHDILHTKYRAATDVYVLMFLADVVDFIIIIFGFWAFGKHSAATDITSSLSDDQVPEAFLVMLLIQFSTMVVDRALYLRKTVLGKLAFQVVLVVAIHLWMFFILPAVTERMFSQNAVAQLWYFVKCIYFALSAYQIRCGYPTRILGNFLTKKYNHLNLFLFQGFRLVPFLVELRAVMDWVWTDTTLSLSNWMCVEDIYANIFIIKCSRETEKKYPQPKGQKKKKIVKYGMGGLIILFLIAIIWFPLLFMSLVRSVVGVVNQPIDVTVTLKLGGYEPLFTMSAQQPSIIPFTSQAYEELSRQFDPHPLAMQFISQYSPEDIVTAQIEGSSGALWRISPPSRAQMKRELSNGNAHITLRFTWNFQRDLAKGGTVENTNEKHTLDLAPNSTARLQLARLLEGTSNQSVSSHRVIPNLFPKYIRAPNGPEANPVRQLQPQEEADYLDVRLQLRREHVGTGAAGFLEWWVVELQDCQADCNLLPMVIFSDKVSPPSLGFLAGYGIMGLYVSIVLVIGKFVRGFFSEISHSIMFEELPCVDRILKLCQDIFLVRETRELELEEELYAKLIFLYRSPETMIKWTREKE
uniref:Piezo type mechanosensitive ion channel component 1 (Er blood group) n=1 Tax=Otolemur garnettii TaxID=30611 RepID=H0XWC8_OTOGA